MNFNSENGALERIFTSDLFVFTKIWDVPTVVLHCNWFLACLEHHRECYEAIGSPHFPLSQSEVQQFVFSAINGDYCVRFQCRTTKTAGFGDQPLFMSINFELLPFIDTTEAIPSRPDVPKGPQ